MRYRRLFLPLVCLLALSVTLPIVAQEPEDKALSTPLEVCQERLGNTKLALTMWMVDHGPYPETLDPLVPEYLIRLIPCPLAGSTLYKYVPESDGKGFTLTCPSDHRADGATEPPFEADDPETEKLVRAAKPD